ncbi:MAG TPA: M10 family metallopeptidase C-terminal domain-containing protein [Allosphingosinicella sp.]|jgi:Ca2+-binding RTX toxin-like protein
MRRLYRDTLFTAAADQLAAAGYAGTDAVTFRTASSAIGFQEGGLNLPSSIILVGADDAGDGIAIAPGNPVVTVGAAPTVGTIGTIGDQDFFQVTLEAGKTYEIGMFSKTGGPSLLGVQDAYLELYDSSGALLGSADGGASTTINMVNSGFDAVLTFSVETGGTYYINARAFDNDPAIGGSTGEGLGDYDLYVNEVDPNDPSVYHPYYDASSPLYALDWGTQVNKVNHTARNPDGDEGSRDTGNAQGTPVYGNPSSISALAAAQGVDITGKNVITIYFAKAGDVFTSIEDPTSPGLPPVLVSLGTQDWEKATVWTALHEFEKVADVVYIEVPTRAEADFFFTTYAGTPGPGVSLLGSMSPPDYPDEGLAQFNSGDYRWTEENMQQGGFSYVTLIHEFGHGHGLAHPHDNGGHSGIMNGVESDGVVADYTTGDFDLNQGIHTMMSYEDGWQTSPYGNAATDAGYGYLGGLMAFDIAVIQDKYGVNEEWATGDDTYVLKDENAVGTFYASIWDAGGTDRIVYEGTKNTTIDLRPATLQYEPGGGGYVSYAYGIYGGFTIAGSVVIENAASGGGDDTLVGNAADNMLDSGAGNDLIRAEFGGDDTLLGGEGHDFFYFGNAMTAGDKVNGGAGTDTVGLIGNYEGLTFGADSLVGVERLMVFSSGFAEEPASYNITTVDANVGADGFFVSAASLTPTESLVFNGSAETNGTFRIQGGAGSDSIAGGAQQDFLAGNGGNDQLFGLAGNDSLTGGGGADTLRGGTGKDIFFFTATGDSGAGGMDRIVDFELVDRIDLTGIDANSSAGGDQAFSFIGSGAFSGAGQLRATFNAGSNLWLVEGDVNGDGNADFALEVVRIGASPIVATDFFL